MATTVVMPPSNSFTLAQKYVPLLDEVYKRESLSAILDTPNVEWTGVDTIKVYKFTPVAMGDYSRDSGYVMGNATGTWETFQIAKDRGRATQIDYLDNEESMSMALASTLSETERVSVIPEIDAYTFAKIAGTSNILSGTPANITVGTTDVPALIDAAEADMDDAEVPYEGRILFVSPTCYQGLKAKIERRIINSENNVNTNVEFYDDMRIIRVPKARFNTAITLAQPTTAAGAGGYTCTGYDINFMIIHPSAVVKAMKHRSVRVFSPEQNIEADGYRVNFRFAHDAFLYDNKLKGVYLHRSTTSA